MSDIRLVNVVPIVNGWNDAAKKNLEEAKTLMASGNRLMKKEDVDVPEE